MAYPFTAIIHRFPPVWCRLLAVRYPANKKWQWPIPMTDEEIAESSGLSVMEVKFIGRADKWDDVSVGKMLAFMRGCRINFDNWQSFQRTRRTAGRGKFDYLRRSPLWDSHFKYLVALWETIHAGETKPE